MVQLKFGYMLIKSDTAQHLQDSMVSSICNPILSTYLTKTKQNKTLETIFKMSFPQFTNETRFLGLFLHSMLACLLNVLCEPRWFINFGLWLMGCMNLYNFHPYRYSVSNYKANHALSQYVILISFSCVKPNGVHPRSTWLVEGLKTETEARLLGMFFPARMNQNQSVLKEIEFSSEESIVFMEPSI